MKMLNFIKNHLVRFVGGRSPKWVLALGTVSLLSSCAIPQQEVTTRGGTKLYYQKVSSLHQVTWSGKTDSQGYAHGTGKQAVYYRNGKLLSLATGNMVNGRFDGEVIHKNSNQRYSWKIVYHAGQIVSQKRFYPSQPASATPTQPYNGRYRGYGRRRSGFFQ